MHFPKIIEPALPDVIFGRSIVSSGSLGAEPSQDPPCKALFDGLHHGGRIASFRLAEQQMDMLRHGDVAHHNEMIAAADVLQYLNKEVAP